jgi:hypothetical protein
MSFLQHYNTLDMKYICVQLKCVHFIIVVELEDVFICS